MSIYQFSRHNVHWTGNKNYHTCMLTFLTSLKRVKGIKFRIYNRAIHFTVSLVFEHMYITIRLISHRKIQPHILIFSTVPPIVVHCTKMDGMESSVVWTSGLDWNPCHLLLCSEQPWFHQIPIIVGLEVVHERNIMSLGKRKCEIDRSIREVAFKSKPVLYSNFLKRIGS